MRRRALTAAILLSLVAARAGAQDRPEFHIERAAQPPKIDGVLDDEVWQRPPLDLDEWLSYNPNRGDRISPEFRTDVYVAYDDRNLYFAFHCVDGEPDKIRTTVSRRDSAFNDDWIAISLDSANTGQTAYHLFVNPSGSQMDALNTSASGEQFDADFVWYSVGKLTADGYIVEMQVPLQSIRFSSGDGVKMGILFFRKISRLGISYSWPTLPPGQWVFDRHARLQFDRLTQPRLVEALPSITYGVSQNRIETTRWDPLDGTADVGLSGKFGITSNITLDGTVNPDFSQVESDAFQVQVNQRYPVFYSEKRPFFMEGMGLFNIAGTGGDSNMRTAVHTRKIVDPMWGTKVTGTAGRTTFGVLNSVDESPVDDLNGLDLGDRQGAIDGHNKLFTIGRATYALGGSNYAGAIVTDTEHGERYNRVVGADLSVKPSATQQISATMLASNTAVEGVIGRGVAGQGTYNYNSRRFTSITQFEHYDPAFQMDTAFMNRTGFTSVWSYNEVNFYPKPDSHFWLQRVHPYLWAKRGHDELQHGSEAFAITGIRFNTTRQGFFDISRSGGHEAWAGRRFNDGRDLNLFGIIQIWRWLNVDAGYNIGPAIYYDTVDPFAGRTHGGMFGFTVQPDQHFTLDVNANFDRFERASHERVYAVNIINARSTYQFNKHFLTRLLEQFDSSTHQLLTDLLASYEFVPGTVFHAGYGSLYERNGTPSGLLAVDGAGQNYLLVNRGLFFKASYLHRF